MAPGPMDLDLKNMRAALEAIELRVTRGSVPETGLADLKSGIDDMRLRLWAIMSAANNPDPDGTIQRFRLRRAIEMCDGLGRDLAAGTLSPKHREFADLQQRALSFASVAATTERH